MNYENYKSDTNNHNYIPKEKKEKNSYYNKEYSYLSSYENNEYFYEPNNQKNEKKISIDYATTQSNSSSHEESNINQYNSNDDINNVNVAPIENYSTNNTTDSPKLNIEEESNNTNSQNNNNIITDFINLNSYSFNLESIPFIPAANINLNTNVEENALSNINTIPINNIDTYNNIDADNNIQIPVSVSLPSIHSIPTPPQPKKNKKSKKTKKFSLSSKDLEVKRSVSSNIESDFQLNQLNSEPYNKFNSVNNDLLSNIINPFVENTEILQVNVKIAKDKNVMFKLRRFDDLFLTVKLFCEINSIEEKLIKPIIIKALCTLNSIYQIYNTQLDSQNIKILKMIKAFESASIDY